MRRQTGAAFRRRQAQGLAHRPRQEGIVVRDRSKVELCEGCLRITVGTEKENKELLKALAKIA